MLSALLHDGEDLLPLKRLIIERTEGTPFFMEEIVQSLFEDGVLERNGLVKLAKSINAVKIPATVQAILAARIDRLPDEEKELLQTLAVIGREFPLSIVKLIVGKQDEDLNQMLAHLQMAEFIYQRPTAGDIEYIFKHALTQEVAYYALLVERRKFYHERVGKALELLFASSLTDHYNELAHHYSHSGNVPKALIYLCLAAEHGMSRSAYTAARSQLESALKLLRAEPSSVNRDRTEAGVLLNLALCVWINFGDWNLSFDYLERARELSKIVGDISILFRSTWFLVFYGVALLDQHKKLKVYRSELLAIALQLGDKNSEGSARSCSDGHRFTMEILLMQSQTLNGRASSQLL